MFRIIKSRSSLDIGIGLEYYSTSFNGVYGRLRLLPYDFVVEEEALDGTIALQSMAHDTERPLNIDWGGSSFSVYVLEKCYRETLSTISLLRKIVKANVGFAGIKDKRALTSQFITIPSSAAINIGDLQGAGFSLRHVGFSRFQLKRGMLRGNWFTITVRDVDFDNLQELDRWLREALSSITSSGLFGYYGYQRFGVSHPITHLIGKHIIRGEEEQAVDLILKAFSEQDCIEANIIRQLISENNLSLALKLCPAGSYEHMILSTILSKGDARSALKMLRQSLKQLFIHGYQAYIFNKALSRMIEERGSIYSIKPGDIVGMLSSWGEATQLVKVTAANVDRLSKLIKERKASLVMPLPGFSRLGGATSLVDVMKEEGVKHSDFRQAGTRGGIRQCVTFPHIGFFKAFKDQISLTSLSYTLRFFLPKGFYATMLLRELIKPESPCKCGF